MRRVLVMVAAPMIVLATAGAAQAQVINMAATLSGANETPPVLTGAFGTATVTVNLGTQTVTWNIDAFNFPSGLVVGHFHVGGVGLAGPTVVDFTIPGPLSNDFNLSGSATSATTLRPAQGIRSWEDFLQSLIGGQVYVNLHSQVNPGGEIRGQVFRVP